LDGSASPNVTVPRQRKEETRERIVRAAARAVRRLGYSGVGVADVKQPAGNPAQARHA
jgi:AcrR family transcriptional regulator